MYELCGATQIARFYTIGSTACVRCFPAMALHAYTAAATLAASSLEGGDFGGLDGRRPLRWSRGNAPALGRRCSAGNSALLWCASWP